MRRCFLSNETTGLTRLRSGQFYRQSCQLLSSSDYAHLLLAIVHFLQIQNHSAIVNHQNLQRPSLSFEMSLDFLIKKKKKNSFRSTESESSSSEFCLKHIHRIFQISFASATPRMTWYVRNISSPRRETGQYFIVSNVCLFPFRRSRATARQLQRYS